MYKLKKIMNEFSVGSGARLDSKNLRAFRVDESAVKSWGITLILNGWRVRAGIRPA